MSLMNKLSHLAKSQQGKDLVDKAKTFANDPKTREKIEGARGKLNEHVETAKQKMADKKANDEGARSGNGGAAPTYGEEGAANPTPTYGEEGAGAAPPPSSHESPVDQTNPTYGEEEGDKPLYGEGDGPKAA